MGQGWVTREKCLLSFSGEEVALGGFLSFPDGYGLRIGGMPYSCGLIMTRYNWAVSEAICCWVAGIPPEYACCPAFRMWTVTV